MTLKKIEIWTDGAYSYKHGRGGWAAVLTYNGSARIIGDSAKPTTNNKMETIAVAGALEALKQPCQVDLYTDSQYVIYGIQRIQRNSRLDSNIEEWERVAKAMQPHKLNVFKVKGHNKNDLMNTLADRFAVLCSEEHQACNLFIKDLAAYLEEHGYADEREEAHPVQAPDYKQLGMPGLE